MSRNSEPRSPRPRQNLPTPYVLEPRPKIAFPPAWLWLVDEALPNYVKKAYSPDPRWKDKPFAKEDVRFFSKGVGELSELFTLERGQDLPDYFSHPKFRSSYLLYFLPLHASKFISLFQIHRAAMAAALEHGKRTGRIRIADLGAGPGTASIAFLLWLLAEKLPAGETLPPIELEWIDSQKNIMEDGRKIVELMASNFPKLRGKVSLRTHLTDWWGAHRKIEGETSLILLGNVLNETRNSPSAFPALLELAGGGGILCLEPATRGNAQNLSRLRDHLFEEGILPSVWGPCLHSEKCPLSEGRDWCHFSVPLQIPGNWFREFSKMLSSERLWAKFSYLWMNGTRGSAENWDPHSQFRRVISDPLPGRSEGSSVLICEPEHPGRMPIQQEFPLYRGDLIRLRKAVPDGTKLLP